MGLVCPLTGLVHLCQTKESSLIKSNQEKEALECQAQSSALQIFLSTRSHDNNILHEPKVGLFLQHQNHGGSNNTCTSCTLLHFMGFLNIAAYSVSVNDGKEFHGRGHVITFVCCW